MREQSAKAVSWDLLGISAPNHALKALLTRQGFEARRAESACPRQQGAPKASCLHQPRPAGRARCPGGGSVPHRRGAVAEGAGCGVLQVVDPRREALGGRTDGRTDRRPRRASAPLPGPEGNAQRSAGSGGRKARRLRLTREAAGPAPSRLSGPGLGASRPPRPTRAASSGGAAIAGLGFGGFSAEGTRWRRERTALSGTAMGTQEARPGSAGVREGGTAGGGGRRRPGAASSPEKHRPPADPTSRPSAPPPGPRRGIAAEQGGHPLPSVRRWSTLSAGRGLGLSSSPPLPAELDKMGPGENRALLPHPP